MFGNIAIIVAPLLRRANPKTWSRDAWLVIGGLSIFTATALYETVYGAMFDPWEVEPFAMLILVLCLGYAAANRVVTNERRVAAVSRELETARRIQQSILPRHAPSVDGVRVASHYEPMSEVAGRSLRLRGDAIRAAGRAYCRRIGARRAGRDHRVDGEDWAGDTA